MKRQLQKLIIPSISALYASPAFALSLQDGADNSKPDGTPSNLSGSTGVFHTVANVLIFLTGAIAVIVLIFGGLRYVTSTGDAARVKQAKDTILDGVIGVVIALLAYAIVNFVIGAFVKPPANP